MFPFFMQSNYNFGYPSAMNYDMCSTNPWNSMNLHMNQAWDDAIARQSLYNVPVYNFNNMFMYGNGFGTNNFLCDPNYTLTQMKFARNGSMPMFGGFGNLGLGEMDFSRMWQNPFGSPNGTGSAQQSSSSKPETAEDIAFKRKYTRLLALCKQLVASDKLSDAQKDILTPAIRNSEGTPKEKFEKLKKEYDKIDKKIVKEFITSKDCKMGPDKTENAGYIDSFYGHLTSAGYEYSASEVDGEISNLKRAIETLRTNPNLEGNNVMGALGFDLQGGNAVYNVLDVLSSWNTQNKGDASARNIIKYIAAHYPNNDTDKETAKNKLLVPIVNGLTKEARKYLDELDSESKTKLEDAIKNVEKYLSESTNGVASGLASAFDRLYVLTREAAIVTLQNEINKNYGAIDPELFNEKLFIDETLEDLKNEGLIDDNAEVEVKVSERRQQIVQENSAPVEETHEDNNNENGTTPTPPVTESTRISSLKEEEIIEPLQAKYVDAEGNEYSVVREKKATGNRTEGRLFIETADGLKELKNAKVEGDTIVAKDSAVQITVNETITKAADIKSAYSAKVAEEEAAVREAERNSALENEREENAAIMQAEAETVAKELFDLLSGWCNDSEWDAVMDGIEKDVTSENVLYVIKEYNKLGSKNIFKHIHTKSKRGRAKRSQALVSKVIEYVEKYANTLTGDAKAEAKMQLVKLKKKNISFHTDGSTIDEIVNKLIEIFLGDED